jgi:hypothetical protein
MWKKGTFQPIQLNSPVYKNFIQKFTTVVSIMVKAFQVTNPNFFREQRFLDGEVYFRKLFASPDIQEELKEMYIEISSNFKIGLQETSPLILDGDFAKHLVRGGAYEDFKGTMAEAKELGREFSEFIFQERYEEVKSFTTENAWSQWFYDIFWDKTWIILDEGQQKLWIICITDTD